MSSVLFCIFLFSFNGFPVKCLERDLWLTQGEAIFTFCSLTLAFNFWWFNSHYTHLWSDGVSIVFLLFTTFLFELKYKTINRTYGFTSIDCKLNHSEDMNGRQSISTGFLNFLHSEDKRQRLKWDDPNVSTARPRQRSLPPYQRRSFLKNCTSKEACRPACRPIGNLATGGDDQ